MKRTHTTINGGQVGTGDGLGKACSAPSGQDLLDHLGNSDSDIWTDNVLPFVGNHKDQIWRLVQSVAGPGVSAVGGLLKDLAPPKISLLTENTEESHELVFPLTDPHLLSLVKKEATNAPVGVNGEEFIDLNKRSSYQLLPTQVSIEGLTDQPAFTDLLKRVQVELCVPETLEAHFYKFLLYEEGSFFGRHRDHERLPNMIGSLVLGISSSHKGGELRVWPTDPAEPVLHGSKSDQSMSFMAFFANCYHEVTKVEQGHRCALVFSITTKNREVKTINCLSDQAKTMAGFVDDWSKESDKDYCLKGADGFVTGLPDKLAIVLSHSYTRHRIHTNGRMCMPALKGKDRAVGELVMKAAKGNFDALIVLLRPISGNDGDTVLETESSAPVILGGSASDFSDIKWSHRSIPIRQRELLNLNGESDDVSAACSTTYQRAALLLWPSKKRNAILRSMDEHFCSRFVYESSEEDGAFAGMENQTWDNSGDY